MSVRVSGEEARERVREATDIVQLIGERVQLRRAGRSYKGLCPFHTEKTPSFTVTPDRQIWHCFGCSKGGDVFAFVMEQDKVTFPEALRMLADRAGIELPKQERGAGEEAFDKLYQANALARDFFRACLGSEGAKKARAYVAARGFEEPWITRFEVGWAPEGWDGLLTTLAKLIPAAVMEQAGLIVRRGDGSGHYDRFRNRMIFPVATAAGKVAGFGARLSGCLLAPPPALGCLEQHRLLQPEHLGSAAKEKPAADGILDPSGLHVRHGAHARAGAAPGTAADQGPPPL